MRITSQSVSSLGPFPLVLLPLLLLPLLLLPTGPTTMVSASVVVIMSNDSYSDRPAAFGPRLNSTGIIGTLIPIVAFNESNLLGCDDMAVYPTVSFPRLSILLAFSVWLPSRFIPSSSWEIIPLRLVSLFSFSLSLSLSHSCRKPGGLPWYRGACAPLSRRCEACRRLGPSQSLLETTRTGI